ncbi:ABC transporter, partial [Mycobacterium kansasii]
EFADKPLTSYKMRDLRWDLGYVLQQIALFPTMTVAQNIAVIPEMKGWSRQKIRTATDELLTTVDLPPAEYRNRMPS